MLIAVQTHSAGARFLALHPARSASLHGRPGKSVGNGGHAAGTALVVFLRGVNVGGHRTFRPSILARRMHAYGLVNVGAAGTFVVRNPGASRAKFHAALLRRLPFEAEIVICGGRDLLRLVASEPFGPGPFPPDTVRFVTILSNAARTRPALPVSFPESGGWLVRVLELRDRFALGTYRRHMKTIGYLGRVDKLFGVPVTTRTWNTILAVARLLQAPGMPHQE